MQAVEISGRFLRANREPISGFVQFVPSKIWVEEDGETYPVLAPEVDLADGQFSVLLTRTDQHDLPWHYTVRTPLGDYTIRVESDGPLLLKDLLPKKSNS